MVTSNHWANEGGSLLHRCHNCGSLYLRDEAERFCPECEKTYMTGTEQTTRVLLDEIIAERRKIQSLPILDTRWYVVEVIEPQINEMGKHIPPDVHRVSPYFRTEEDALIFKEAHPRNGHQLETRVQYLREFKEKRWSSF